MIGLLLIAVRILLRGNISVDLSSRSKVSKHEYSWYYIKTPNAKYLSQFSQLPQEKFHLVDKSLFTAMLSHSTAERLSSNSRLWVKKIPSSHKGNTTGKLYMVYSSPECEIPGKVLTRSGNFAITQFEGPRSILAKTNCIRSFDSISDSPKLCTAFNRAFTQDIPLSYLSLGAKENSVLSHIHSQGINGAGQCVAYVDTGLDIKNQWFTAGRLDRLVRFSSLRHPKVISYLNFADDKDDPDGHGTFIGGIIAGSSTCHPLGPMFSGFAPMARILPIDVKKSNETKFTWPKNFSDVFEVPSYLGCKIHLNAWTMKGSPLLTQYINTIAYNNPSVLYIFPADGDEFISSPADAKNVLTVGATSSHMSSQSIKSTGLPVEVQLGPDYSPIMGYTESSGAPLLGSPKSTSLMDFQPLRSNSICVDGNVSDFSNCSAVLTFGKTNLKLKCPIVRLPTSSYLLIMNSSEARIRPSLLQSDDSSRVGIISKYSHFGTPNIFKVKPEIVAPGGPMIGPKAGSHNCTFSDLTMKEGTSVAAAVIAADAALIRQYFLTNRGKNLTGASVKALLINSAGENSAPSLSEGWGTPILTNILTQSTMVFENITLESESFVSFTVSANTDGVIRATICWLDLPRDPYSLLDISSQISLTISTDDHTAPNTIANNGEADFPTIDVFNTVKQANRRVSSSSVIRINIVSGEFPIDCPVNVSVVISGAVKSDPKHLIVPEIEKRKIPCERDCISRGQCIKGQCSCASDRGGDFCDFKAEKIGLRSVWRGTLRRFEWHIFKHCPQQWAEGDYLSIPLDNLPKENIGLNIHVGQFPKWGNALCTLDYCLSGRIDGNNLILPYKEWSFVGREKCFMFGIYSKINFTQVEFLVDANSTAK